MTSQSQEQGRDRIGLEIRVRGRVQGVGFRPMVWKLARELNLAGDVRNDPEGVLIRASGPAAALDQLIQGLRHERPPLASIERIEFRPIAPLQQTGFEIAPTIAGEPRTEVAPDAAICVACAREVLDRHQRRHGYPFTNCTHCGPRLTIVTGIPYDRAKTTMAHFALCADCEREYGDPSDRRFHAEAIACPACGPKAQLVSLGRAAFDLGSALDVSDAAGDALLQGLIVAIKGLGGYQLACDAGNEETVCRLRAAKKRPAKPLALMARDLDVIRRYCKPTAAEESLLASSQAPIVVMRANGPERLPDAVAPGLGMLGFMLPSTPLHMLVLRRIDRPVVMTSGNLSDEPQIIDDEIAVQRLAGVADLALMHDRKIAVRVDDSVVRTTDGAPRLLRRARGYAPAPIKLPAGFEAAPPVLAFGGDLKSTFCLTMNGLAVLSQHQGDLESAATFD